MRKDSPVDRFPGYVELPEYLTLPQVRAFEDALGSLRNMKADDGERVWLSVLAEKQIPVILNCVDEWHIEGIPEKPSLDTFPMTPIAPANELVAWIYNEIRLLWLGETQDPKN